MNLVYVVLTCNDLASPPESFARFVNLRHLRFGSNELCSLGESFGGFANLDNRRSGRLDEENEVVVYLGCDADGPKGSIFGVVA